MKFARTNTVLNHVVIRGAQRKHKGEPVEAAMVIQMKLRLAAPGSIQSPGRETEPRFPDARDIYLNE